MKTKFLILIGLISISLFLTACPKGKVEDPEPELTELLFGDVLGIRKGVVYYTAKAVYILKSHKSDIIFHQNTYELECPERAFNTLSFSHLDTLISFDQKDFNKSSVISISTNMVGDTLKVFNLGKDENMNNAYFDQYGIAQKMNRKVTNFFIRDDTLRLLFLDSVFWEDGLELEGWEYSLSNEKDDCE